MAVPSRMALATLVALALAGPAQAANGDAPGALKKQTTTPEATAPAPAPAPVQAPAATVPSTDTAPSAHAKTDNTKAAPVTQGSGKKVGQVRTTTQTAAPSSPAVRRPVRRASARRPAARRTASRRRQAARGRPHAVPVAARGKAQAPGQQVAAGAPLTAPGRSVAAARRRAAAAKAKARKKAEDPAPLTSLSRTADHVIEVIPGAVILALAGLTALVLLLVLRSLAVERQRGKALVTSYGVTVEALASAIEAKDHTTGGHIERVRRLGLLLASEIVPRETRDPQMAYGFLLHDIGKLAVPDAILRAPGRLTEEQWALMRRHPEEGVRMLSCVPFLERAVDVVRHHHERWDGGGYPDGLAGEAIPLWARIFAVVDALDAMTAERPYRAARSYAAALAEIRRHAGTQFDPTVVEALEGIDPAKVEPLLEPTQQVEPLAELPSVGPLVAA